MKLVLGMEVGLSPDDFVLDRDLVPSPKGGRAPSPIFSPFPLCQTTGWIKMALGMEVGLSPVHIVLDGDTPPPKKRGQGPN